LTSSIAERFAELAVDQSHTFFFDHPLDHVPGTLLVSSALDLALEAEADGTAGAVWGRVRLDVRFTKICESDRPTTLSCSRAGEGWDWEVVAVQDGRAVCTATVGFDPGAPPAGAPGDTVAEAADACLVHRHRPENIMVGEVRRPDDGPPESLILPPPDGHPLRSLDPEFRTPIEIAEAGRQFGIMLEHTESALPLDAQMLWLSMAVDIPYRVRRDVPLSLRSVERLHRGHRAISTMLLAEAATGAELGRITLGSYNVDPARYARMRLG
jgi:2-oxo-3-(phosphooxy)propyl 3-oxoalkanoate synthase